MKNENRALHIQIRYEPAPVIPLKQEGSLLEWLDANNRIIYREEKAPSVLPVEEEEFDLMEGDDSDYDSDLGDEEEDELD